MEKPDLDWQWDLGEGPDDEQAGIRFQGGKLEAERAVMVGKHLEFGEELKRFIAEKRKRRSCESAGDRC